MRVKNSFLNVSSNFIIIFLKIILAFVVRTVFINKLGEEYLGIDGLFINILNMISLTELGIGTAINYLLYKPLANKDYKKVSTIMSFFKRTYFIIGLIVSAIGIIIMFFIPSIVGNISIDVNLYLIFALYLINTVFIYFISYKDTLILADQKNYKLTGIYVSINILTSIFQIVVLFLYRSFILYLVVQLVLNFIQRIIINKYNVSPTFSRGGRLLTYPTLTQAMVYEPSFQTKVLPVWRVLMTHPVLHWAPVGRELDSWVPRGFCMVCAV